MESEPKVELSAQSRQMIEDLAVACVSRIMADACDAVSIQISNSVRNTLDLQHHAVMKVISETNEPPACRRAEHTSTTKGGRLGE